VQHEIAVIAIELQISISRW